MFVFASVCLLICLVASIVSLLILRQQGQDKILAQVIGLEERLDKDVSTLNGYIDHHRTRLTELQCKLSDHDVMTRSKIDNFTQMIDKTKQDWRVAMDTRDKMILRKIEEAKKDIQNDGYY